MSYFVSTLAGDPTSADELPQGLADGVGTAASFDSPTAVAADAAGNLYVADTRNHCVRKITPAGEVSTLAGIGLAGHADGAGAAAMFNHPRGVVASPDGQIYVADSHNHLIRVISPAGEVATLAGLCGQASDRDGVGDKARFSYPLGLALDGAGNMVVADAHNDCLRRITPAGAVSTVKAVAEAGASGLRDPVGVAITPDGTLFVTERSGQVREISPDGQLTTLAGGTEGYGPEATCFRNGRGTEARFCFPSGIVVLPDGCLLVADTLNGLVRKLTRQAEVTTFAIAKGEGLACSATGWLYLADGTASILSISPAGEVAPFAGDATRRNRDGAGAEARFDRLEGIAVDAAGQVYVSDVGNGSLRRCSPDGRVTTLGGRARDRSALEADAPSFEQPGGLAVDTAGNLYVAERRPDCILKLEPAGSCRELAGPGSADYADGAGATAGFNYPAGLAVGLDGMLYVADRKNHCIRKIAPDGWVSTLAGDATRVHALGSSGEEWGTCGDRNGLGVQARFNAPAAVAVDAAGTVYVADTANHRIRKITRDGLVSTLAGHAAGYKDGSGARARFSAPVGLAVDAAGTVFVADRDNHCIRCIAPDGLVTTLAGTGAPGHADGPAPAARFSSPVAVALDALGQLYVAEAGNRCIRKIGKACP